MEDKDPEQPLDEETVPATETNESVPPPENGATDGETTVTEQSNPETEAQQTEEDELETTDGKEFAARYQSAKERDMEKLSKEMEDRSQVNKKKKWKTAIKVIAMVILIGLSIGIMFGVSSYVNGGQSSLTELKNSFSWQYFLVFLAAIAAYIFFESLKYAYLLKISMGKWRLKNSIKVMFLGKYYDGITPLGTGGQPFQIYYLHKRNVPAGVATAVPLVKYIVSTFVFGIICAVFLGIAPSQFAGDSAVSDKLTLSFMIIAWISLFFNLSVPTIMVLLSAFPKVGKRIIVWIVKVLSKMHIVKHKYPVTKKYVYEVAEYRNALKLLIRKWYLLIPLIFITLAETLIYLSMPFFSVLAIAGNLTAVTPSWELLLHTWCLAALSFYTASLIPTPGNSGASEATSSIVFLTVSGITAVSGWVVLAWRFATFYLYIVVGICISVFTMIRDAVRAKRNRNKQNDGALKQ